jgi:hypothetical protein
MFKDDINKIVWFFIKNKVFIKKRNYEKKCIKWNRPNEISFWL